MRQFTLTIVTAWVLALVISTARAQSLASITIDGGGGVSSEPGGLTITGTVGQVDAGLHLDLSGSPLRIEGGFWQSSSPAVPVELLRFEIVWNAENWIPWNRPDLCAPGRAGG